MGQVHLEPLFPHTKKVNVKSLAASLCHMWISTTDAVVGSVAPPSCAEREPDGGLLCNQPRLWSITVKEVARRVACGCQDGVRRHSPVRKQKINKNNFLVRGYNKWKSQKRGQLDEWKEGDPVAQCRCLTGQESFVTEHPLLLPPLSSFDLCFNYN